MGAWSLGVSVVRTGQSAQSETATGDTFQYPMHGPRSSAAGGVMAPWPGDDARGISSRPDAATKAAAGS